MKTFKVEKRKLAITFLELWNGGMLLFSLYASMLALCGRGQTELLWSGLLLVLVNAILSISVKKLPHFWQYAGIAILLVVSAISLAGKDVRGIWVGILGTIAVISYFYCRASKIKCWLDMPVYPWLLLYLLMYIIGRRFESDPVVAIVPYLAAVYYLICNFYINLNEVEQFLKSHASLERLPVRRLARINQGMMWMVSGVTVLAMIAAPFLGMDHLIETIGNGLKTILRWIFQLLPKSTTEGEMISGEMQQQMMPQGGNAEIPYLLQLFYKLLDVIGWLIAIGMIVACLYLFVRMLYRWYLRFNEGMEENGDKIERLMPTPTAEKKKSLERKKREYLFWDRSANGRIRKHYRKKVLEKLKKTPDLSWTPLETAEEMALEESEAKVFCGLYEKARYGKDSCTKEEMEQMLKIR